MKKIIVSALLLGVITIGCAKKRTCTEMVTQTNGTVNTYVTTYDKLTHKEKKDQENLGTYIYDNGTVYKTTCK